MQSLRLAVEHALGETVFLGATALDHVGGERPGAAGETDQRYQTIEFVADQCHRVGDIAQALRRIGHEQAIDIGFAAHRAFEAGAFASAEIQAEIHRVGDGQDVGEQDRGIQIETPQRLQGDFAGQFRRLAQREKVTGLFAGGAVFRQVAAGLTHDPYRRGIGGLTQQGLEIAVVAQFGKAHGQTSR